ncbi:hypothetical protein Cp1R7AA1_083 [Mesorhizobium phage Cp1R7A-A1]|nr:hypothetical protein Cp1R7AA1_083 [Mesorhizobium phage Cp1R7A-A1]
MPHELNAYRDAIDALIGPIEEIIAKVEALPAEARKAAFAAYTLGGLEQAKDTLGDTVASIDEFEEPEVETETEEEPEPDEEDDEDTDEDED